MGVWDIDIPTGSFVYFASVRKFLEQLSPLPTDLIKLVAAYLPESQAPVSQYLLSELTQISANAAVEVFQEQIMCDGAIGRGLIRILNTNNLRDFKVKVSTGAGFSSWDNVLVQNSVIEAAKHFEIKVSFVKKTSYEQYGVWLSCVIINDHK